MKTRKSLKLYRGISANEFQYASDKLFAENRQIWHSLLQRRAAGKFDYPLEMDKAVTTLHTKLRFEHQYFTDSKSIAEGYAKKVSGILVEIQVSVEDIVKNFDIEFQNFSKRKRQFEIVYGVKGSVLLKFAEAWRFKVRRKK